MGVPDREISPWVGLFMDFGDAPAEQRQYSAEQSDAGTVRSVYRSDQLRRAEETPGDLLVTLEYDRFQPGFRLKRPATSRRPLSGG